MPKNKESEGNPQTEDGFTKFANELLDAFITSHSIPDYPRSVWLAILRLTYGFNRKTAEVSMGTLSKYTGIPRRHIPKILQWLEIRKMIRIDRSGKILLFGLNKKWKEWGVPQPGDMGVPYTRDTSVPQPGDRVSHGSDRGVPQEVLQVSPRSDQSVPFPGDTFDKNTGQAKASQTPKDSKDIKDNLKKGETEEFFSSGDGSKDEKLEKLRHGNWRPEIPLPPPRKWFCPKCGKEMTSKFNETDLCFGCFRGGTAEKLQLEPGDFEAFIPHAEVKLSEDEFEKLKKNAARMALGIKIGKEI